MGPRGSIIYNESSPGAKHSPPPSPQSVSPVSLQQPRGPHTQIQHSNLGHWSYSQTFVTQTPAWSRLLILNFLQTGLFFGSKEWCEIRLYQGRYRGLVALCPLQTVMTGNVEIASAAKSKGPAQALPVQLWGHQARDHRTQRNRKRTQHRLSFYCTNKINCGLRRGVVKFHRERREAFIMDGPRSWFILFNKTGRLLTFWGYHMGVFTTSSFIEIYFSDQDPILFILCTHTWIWSMPYKFLVFQY